MRRYKEINCYESHVKRITGILIPYKLDDSPWPVIIPLSDLSPNVIFFLSEPWASKTVENNIS